MADTCERTANLDMSWAGQPGEISSAADSPSNQHPDGSAIRSAAGGHGVSRYVSICLDLYRKFCWKQTGGLWVVAHRCAVSHRFKHIPNASQKKHVPKDLALAFVTDY